MKAVIDWFEGEYAVIFFGEEDIKVDIPRQLFPPRAREDNGLKVSFELDPEGESKQREKLEGLLDKLRKKNQ